MAKARYKSLDEFLTAHKTKEGEVATNTRIPNVKLNVYPGSYCIPEEKRKELFKLYNKKVLRRGRAEHLTEIQNKVKGGPILIDLDFRFPLEVEDRKFEEDMIYDLLEKYADIIKNMLQLPDKTEWKAFVFLKDNVNQCPEKKCTKDGIHIIIGLHMHHAGQVILRNELVDWVKKYDFLEDLQLLNSENGKKKYVDDVFDMGISTGDVGWQMYGSKKPGNESYKLKYIYNYTYDISDDDIIIKEETTDIDKYNNKAENFSIHKIWNEYEVSEKYKEIYEKEKENILKKIKKKSRKNTIISKTEDNTEGVVYDVPAISMQRLNELSENEDLNGLSSEINKYFRNIDSNSLVVKEAHDILMELSDKYYTDYHWWIRVGWIMRKISSKKNVNKMLCLFVFVKFSSKWEKFNFKDIDGIIERWNGMNENGDLNFRTLYYWLQQENPKAAKKVKNSQLNTYIEKTLGLTGVFMPAPSGDGKKKRENPHIGTDWDLAKLAHCAFGDTLRCVSIQHNKWFSYENHRWHECDSGHALRSALSEKISKLYIQKQSETLEIIRTTSDQAEQEKLTTKAAIYNNIASKLKKTSTKAGIFKACQTIFYEANFTERLNVNPMLLVFTNGVYDFEIGQFRDGRPSDMMSFSTNINYINKIDETNKFHKEGLNFWNNFMNTIFVDESLRKYMWEHAANCMTGIQTQAFWMYVGGGSNGKSMFVTAINTALGEYHHTLDMSTITQKRPPNGKAIPEIAELRGKRYATMQESSKGETINEGIMKQYTGGDKIMGRALYAKPSYFVPQFKLVACTNNLFGVKSTDNGTWRRIKKVDYESKFVKGRPSSVPADKEFAMDEDVKEKIPKYIEIFASLLCGIANKTKGKHSECEKINASSAAYKQTQDYLARFVSEKVKKAEASIKISKQNIKQEFKQWWSTEYSTSIPSKWGQELVEYLDKKLGKYERRGWHGWEIIYDTYDDEEADEEIQGV